MNNSSENYIINYLDNIKKNLYLNSIKITKLKNKLKGTNYIFFEYNNIFHSEEPFLTKTERIISTLKSINCNFLITSFFCNDNKKTSLLIDFLKHDIEHEFTTYNYNKIDYSYSKNLERANNNENLYDINTSVQDSINLNLIFDISLIDSKNRNFSNCQVKDGFLIAVCDEEILFFHISDLMLMNINLICYSFKFFENFKGEDQYSFLKRNFKNIPQAFNWPIICGLRPKLKEINQRSNFIACQNNLFIEKSFLFLYYNCINLFFFYKIDFEI